MSREWFRYRRDKGIPKGAVRFEIFADWIKAQASIELERIGSDKKESLSSSSLTTPSERTGIAPSQTTYQTPHVRGSSTVGISPGPDRVPTDDCKICGRKDHDCALQCGRFQRMGVKEQWEACTSAGKRLCRNCLKSRCELFGKCSQRRGQCRTCQDSHHQDMQCKPEGMRSLSSPFNSRRQ